MKTIELKGHSFELKKLDYQYDAYIFSDDTKLSDAYDRWSRAKERAYEYCVGLARKCDYVGYAIVSYNSFMFTFGFTFYCDGYEWFAYITRDHDYVMRLD